MERKWTFWKRFSTLTCIVIITLMAGTLAFAQPVPGGTLDPTTIPKYVQPLVIPPVMPKSVPGGTPAADYNIAVRQFKQQILPGGIWTGGVGGLPATTVWSYGRAEDPLPDSSGITGGAVGVAPAMNSTFNYPALTIENTSNVATKVRWINDLVDKTPGPTLGNFLPHLLPVDQSVMWANPPTTGCVMGPPNATDCRTNILAPYTGPVPFVTHVHGAHVQANSDGYPMAWWLPDANNIPVGYSLRGSNYTQADNTNTVPGSAFYAYENTQPAATIWYHDHAMGMTRLNVYAGPAGFWLIRGGANGDSFVDNFSTPAANDGVLPGPAPSGTGDPNFNTAYRNTIREIPIAIQDRSFNADGSLFYPADRSFFDGFTGPYIGNTGFTGPYTPGTPGPPPTPPLGPSDIHGIWNPEAFFNTMVVNGTTWPKLDVAPARYRLRLLNGCNSRTLNLAMFVVTAGTDTIFGTPDDVITTTEIPFYQIGADQGFLPKVVMIQTGFATILPGDGSPLPVPPYLTQAAHPAQALLMLGAERADVIVDFTGMPNGTRIRMINTAPDAPFGGFPDVPADPGTTGQVMDFIVNTALPAQPTDTTSTPPQNLVLPVEAPLGTETNTRQVSLNEMSSDQVCVEVNALTGVIVGTLFSVPPGDPTFLATCAAAAVGPGNAPTPMGPREALLGVLTTNGLGQLVAVPKTFADPITETPLLNSTEVWEIFNTTVDGHPIHLHLVAFEVVNRQLLNPTDLLAGILTPTGPAIPPRPNELGRKDTVLALPGQVTRIKAKFDIAGLYVWHCHIVEHEDNEMMRPYVVSTDLLYASNAGTGIWQWDGTTWSHILPSNPELMAASGSLMYGYFGAGNGIWKWDGTTWSQITPNVPTAMAASGSLLYGNFGTGNGIWKWDGIAWSQITPNVPTAMAASGSLLYGNFGTGNGIWKWNGAAWSQITPNSPTAMASSGSLLYGDFGTGNGIWKWDGIAWSQITPNAPTAMAASGSLLYGDFGTGNGIWKWNGAAWSQITPNSPTAMAASGSFLYGDFGASGIWKWDGIAWSQITPNDPTIMATAF